MIYWLVVSTPLNNMKVSQYMEKSNMFQTTNQINFDLACFCVFSGEFEALSTLNGD